MPVDVKSMSRLKAMLIATGVLLVGLAVIFGAKYLMMQSGKAVTPTAESQD